MKDGTKKAIESVKGNNQYFFDAAYAFSENWILNRKETFTSEDLIEAYNAKGNLQPTDLRAWGAVIVALKKNKRIVFQHYAKYRKPCGHDKPSSVWLPAWVIKVAA